MVFFWICEGGIIGLLVVFFVDGLNVFEYYDFIFEWFVCWVCVVIVDLFGFGFLILNLEFDFKLEVFVWVYEVLLKLFGVGFYVICLMCMNVYFVVLIVVREFELISYLVLM